jgi:IS1 family transposase
MYRQRNVVESEFDAAKRSLERENERLREDLLNAKRDIKCVLS